MSTRFELPLGDPIPFPGCDLTRAHEEVRCLARAALRRAQEARPDWTPPPFEPEIVANALGIAVHTRPGPLEWDAIMVPMGEKTQIICNAAVRSPARRRFSVAHEIAHAFFRDATATYHLRTGNRDRYYRTEEARWLERLCDLGAAELLMPGDHVSKYVGRIGLRASAIPEIARAFGVSLQAVAIRLVELAAEPCAAGFFQYGPQPSLAAERRESKPEPRSRNAYRATRVYRSPGFPFLFPRGKSVPDESSIYRASMCLNEIEAVEKFHLGRFREKLHVTAVGLHRGREVGEPPTVCVLLRLTGCGAAGADETACRIETGSQACSPSGPELRGPASRTVLPRRAASTPGRRVTIALPDASSLGDASSGPRRRGSSASRSKAGAGAPGPSETGCGHANPCSAARISLFPALGTAARKSSYKQ